MWLDRYYRPQMYHHAFGTGASPKCYETHYTTGTQAGTQVYGLAPIQVWLQVSETPLTWTQDQPVHRIHHGPFFSVVGRRSQSHSSIPRNVGVQCSGDCIIYLFVVMGHHQTSSSSAFVLLLLTGISHHPVHNSKSTSEQAELHRGQRDGNPNNIKQNT